MPLIAQSVFALVDQIAAASNTSEIWTAYLGASKTVGLPFAGAWHVPLNRNLPFEVVAEAFPPGWIAEYEAQNLAAGDLLLERTRASTKSFEWRMADWSDVSLTAIQRKWRDHNLDRGIHGGVNILDFRPGENMLLVVCGPDGGMSKEDRLALIFAGQEVTLRLRELGVVASPDQLLSRRERECLQWVAAGKTDWEVGQILSLSEKTVNVYIERAKQKLGAKSRAKAIILASRAGIIAA